MLDGSLGVDGTWLSVDGFNKLNGSILKKKEINILCVIIKVYKILNVNRNLLFYDSLCIRNVLSLGVDCEI